MVAIGYPTVYGGVSQRFLLKDLEDGTALTEHPGRSRAPFGFTRVKFHDGVKERPTLELEPEAAPVVQEIFESSMRGNGVKEIL